MALKLTLKPFERIIVNGCVLRNGSRRQTLEVENRADVLRGEEMLDAASARTPVRKTAYAMQIALVSPQHRDTYIPQIHADLDALAQALPRFAPQIDQARAQVDALNFYSAFRALAELIAHEDRLFAHLEQKQP